MPVVAIENLTDPFRRGLNKAKREAQSRATPENLNLLAALVQLEGDDEAALRILNRSLTLDPGNAQAKYFKSLMLLTTGDYEEGFKLYENRYAVIPNQTTHTIAPQWEGLWTKDVVFVWQEGGYGDAIMFSRYFQKVLHRCPKAVLSVHPLLVELLAFNFPNVISTHSGTDPNEKVPVVLCTWQASVQSLPYILGVTRDRIQGTPYLKAPTSKIQQWMPVVAAQKNRIGFCWRGSPVHDRDLTRSIPMPLVEEFGKKYDLLALMPETMPVTNWADTAGIIAHLDLVISVDTAVAHLAAAMGKPTWILLPFDVDWRWGRESATTPWYDSVRLFRCKSHGAWHQVFDEVAEGLR